MNLESEIICGYEVPAKMKRLWAKELDLVKAFVAVCERHGLAYRMMGGALLGAVRHQGFIPWDNDIDLAMPRCDFEKLYSIGPQEFKHPYFYQTEETDRFFCRNFAHLRNSDTTAIQEWEKNFKYPYNQGVFIDIFPMDNIPDDEADRKDYFARLTVLNDKAWQWRNMVHWYRPKKDKGWKKRVSYFLKHVYFKYLSRKEGDCHFYLNQHHALVVRYNDRETKFVGESIIAPLGRWIWKREWVDEVILVPFEMLHVPVPVGYEECLNVGFGEDWRVPKHAPSLHGNVIFDVEKPYMEYLK